MHSIGEDNALVVREPKHACMIDVSTQGIHRFGGKRTDLKVRGVELPKPIHHVLSLATADPLCPIESSRCSVIPLLYPLLYGMGGGEIQYSIISDTEVEIHYLSECHPEDPYVDHEALPEAQVALREFSYAEERLVCALEGGSFTRKKLSLVDRYRLRRCDNGDFWRVGGRFESCQGPVTNVCRNPSCNWRESFGGNAKTFISPIALVQATTRQFGPIWGQYSEDVQFYFGYCPHCGAIHAENRCT